MTTAVNIFGERKVLRISRLRAIPERIRSVSGSRRRRPEVDPIPATNKHAGNSQFRDVSNMFTAVVI